MATSSPRAWATLATLTAINLVNYADRYVTSGTQELLRRDPSLLGGARDAAGLLSDAGLGLLSSAFMVVYMLAAPFTGSLGDRLPRRHLVAAGVFLWSLATVASGLAPSYGTLLVARACIGVGEAGYATVAPSLIADLFDRGRRGKALGIFYAVMPVGAAAGFAVGGAVGAEWGWRSAFLVAGAPGFLLALVALALPEPARGAADGAAPGRDDPVGAVATLRALVANRGWRVATIGMALMTFSVGGLANWMPSFLTRSTGLPVANAGPWFGAVTATAGLMGTVTGTWLGEVAIRRRPGGYLLVSGLGFLLAAPCVVWTAASTTPGAAVVASFAALFFAMLNTGPLNTALVNAVPAALRARAIATSILFIHLFGDSVSPFLVGALSDATGSLALAVAANALPLAAAGAVLLAGARPGRLVR